MTAPVAAPRKWYQISLTQQIMLGLVLGVAVGWWMSENFSTKDLDPTATAAVLARKQLWVEWLGVVRDIFLHLIKVMIAPLIFASVVQGFAGTGHHIFIREEIHYTLFYFCAPFTFSFRI